ncbi:CDP-diacylglycerol diphosphatase [Siculibacillus lacustris]|uniref:CDP-diacylglycerol pyrophosphatase n=1 Tax=Siculibacillus lacustris TaxID=1549641 RepID=A0A4Q9VW44_9HYPH|nr:CDP-diacylglycerol diphosphatase [Siculibacillus lacustris]TBW40043.1 CDP-diacylglycerol diphosphatase [Siculibacillus lacustris]
MEAPKIARLSARRAAAVLIAVGCLLAGIDAGSALEISHRGLSLGPNDLWRVVTYVCGTTATVGVPYPCSDVTPATDREPGRATLVVGSGHVLTVPLRRMVGIEAPAFLAPESAAYWQAAWHARDLVAADAGRPLDRSEVALAVNSKMGRSQNQLHIHTACVRPEVVAAIEADRDRIGDDWVVLRRPIEGVLFSARRVTTPDLATVNVAALLPESIRRAPAAMARQTLVVVGAKFDHGRDGFWVLNVQASSRFQAHGESLLDFDCGRRP